MTGFNEHPILYVLLWVAVGIGFVGLICYWIWNWFKLVLTAYGGEP